MEYRYSPSRITFTPAMQEFVENHFRGLEKYLSVNEPLKFTLEKDGQLFVLKCQIVSKMNKRIRSEIRDQSFHIAVTEAKSNLDKQLKKRKEKSYWKERIDRVKISPEVVEEASLFVKKKVFILDSITPEQAVDEMENLSHDWYAFRDADNGDKISVVYRRFDGETFGLVVLE